MSKLVLPRHKHVGTVLCPDKAEYQYVTAQDAARLRAEAGGDDAD
jgi:hypothetical protein